MQTLRIAATIGLAAAGTIAQSPLYSDFGVNSVDKMGYSTRCAGDVNADGYVDLIYSAPFTDTFGRDKNGIVRVISGMDGSLLYQFDGPRTGDEYGYAVDGIGDMDGDGHSEFLITVLIGQQTFAGAAEVRSGATGSILYELTNTGSPGDPSAYDYMGISGCGVGDFDGDGRPDWAVGTPAQDVAPLNNNGTVHVMSGGTPIVILEGDQGGEEFGWWVNPAGDVDADGYADLIVGSPKYDGPNGPDAGRARVFSGRTHQVLHVFDGATPGSRLGWCVGGGFDVDADGHDDVVVGAHLDDTNGTDTGLVRVYSGATGALLYQFLGTDPSDHLGWSVALVGDIDGDGHSEIAAGAYMRTNAHGAAAGTLYVWSGADGSLLHSFDGATPGAQMGFAVGAAGDIDRDGYADLILGAAFDGRPGTDAGVMEVYSFGGTGQPPVLWGRGKPCLGSNGLFPRLGVRGRPAVDNTFTITLRGAPAGAPALLNLGDSRDIDLTPFGAPGCAAYSDPNGINTGANADANGAASVPIPLPNDPALVGLRLDFQWFLVDLPANTLGFTASQAAAITFGQ